MAITVLPITGKQAKFYLPKVILRRYSMYPQSNSRQMENTSLALTGLWGSSNHWAPNIQSSGARPTEASIETNNSGRAR